jgi:hypothetical protein
MFEVLKHILNGQNQFASGGLLLMVLGSIGVFLRGLPVQLWSWLVEQTTMMITVKDDDDSFVWVKEWFLEQKFLKSRVEALDPALLRPGRIDYRLFMGEASEPQRIELYCRFFPQATEPEAREFALAPLRGDDG